MQKAWEYFCLSTHNIETPNNILIGDGAERFWVKKSAMDIEIPVNDPYDEDEFRKAYDNWCISAKVSNIFKISASTHDGHDANQFEVHDLNARFETIEEAEKHAEDLRNEYNNEYVFDVLREA